MALKLLEKHTLVLAGAGSGKTVLLKRLIEESLILGIPSDRHRLRERPGDPGRGMVRTTPRVAGRGSAESRAVPPQEGCRPLDPREGGGEPPLLRAAARPLALVPRRGRVGDGGLDGPRVPRPRRRTRSLPGVAATSWASSRSRSATSPSTAGGGSRELIDLLGDLPPDAGLGVANEAKLAKQIADALKVRDGDEPHAPVAGDPPRPRGPPGRRAALGPHQGLGHQPGRLARDSRRSGTS